MILGLVLAWQTCRPHEQHELLWAGEGGAPASVGFGAWWYIWVARPIFVALLLGWLWRLILISVLFRRISRLDLALVPTNPRRSPPWCSR